MAEAVVDRLPETRLIQYTLGMNSRGFSISYARDRTSATAPVSMTRLALGLPFPRGAVGVAVTLYRATARAEGVDVGLGYRLTPTADVAAVVRHLGGPVVRGVRTPVLAVAGARWQPVPRVITLDAEVAAADSGGGFTKEVQYRGMLRVATPGRSRVELLGGVELGSEGVARWVVGMSVGTANWLGGVGGASRGFGLDRPDRLSIAGVMSHRGSTVSR
jgi:hypothetical protein